jgi:hypothetical protein
MAEDPSPKDAEGLRGRAERRSGEDRRKGDSGEFFARGGIERRNGVEARQKHVRWPGGQRESEDYGGFYAPSGVTVLLPRRKNPLKTHDDPEK